MKQVKCPKCGRNYYLDNNPVCPFCGADNSDHSFNTHEIPKTIEELKQWYKDRNLPDENVTRFFIGKNYTKPKAFGIYEENGEFIVYKNKANGQRAIRYKGPNEAFAVKELYVRLKEEILNQKKRKSSSESYSYSDDVLSRFIVAIVVSFVLLFPFVVVYGLSGANNNSSITKYQYAIDESEPWQYYQDDFGNFYCMDSLDPYVYWYVLNPETAEWELYAAYGSEHFPNDVLLTSTYESTIENATGLTPEEFSFYNSKPYHEHHRYRIYSSSYYLYNDELYYYLYDGYSGYYNDDFNLSGWYIFDKETMDWAYCFDIDHLACLDDEILYNYKEYKINSSDCVDYFEDYYEDSYSYTDYDFEDSDYYLDYKDSCNDYQTYIEEYEKAHSTDGDSDWHHNDRDSDYDWGSSDSWDSSSSDWDSDW